MAGYAQTVGGYGYYKPPAAQKPPGRSLALAASGNKGADIFGLLTDTTDSAHAAARHATPPAAAPAAAAPASGTPTTWGLPPGQSLPVPGTAAWTALVSQQQTPATKPFDINTDPTYGEAVALAGKSDSDATSGALTAKEQTLLGYGDPNLTKSVLHDDTLAQAAANNPTSTLANLAQQRTQNTHDLTENLNKDNLAFGGYRITQEDHMAHDYQNALASAAANVNQALGGIDSQLGSQLDANAQQRIQAALAAYAAHKGDVGAPDTTPPPLDASGAGGSDAAGGSNLAGTALPALTLNANDPHIDRRALALAAAQRGSRSVGY